MQVVFPHRISNKGVILTSPHGSMVPIIKPVGDYCNLRCNYCFYHKHDQNSLRKMSHNLLEKFIREYFSIFTGRLDFIWHGGEPLLAGLPFFERFIFLQSKYSDGKNIIRNLIQTNGTLINDSWASFFKDHDFKVGVSIDGDSASHNAFRKNRLGRDTFEKVRTGIELLRCHGVEPGIIQTVTQNNLSHGNEDFDFFQGTLKVRNLGLNAYHSSDEGSSIRDSQSVNCQQLTEYLFSYFDKWLERDNPDLILREAENYISGVLGKRAPNCSFNGTCTNFFCVDFDGKVFPCDRSSHRIDLQFGDLSRQHLLDVLNSSTRIKYVEKVNALPEDCVTCKWYNACHNGCTMLRVGSISGKYFYCKTRMEVFSYWTDKIEKFVFQANNKAKKGVNKDEREKGYGCRPAKSKQ